jgi:glycosyltransferase involved in cell wall biosynthesis
VPALVPALALARERIPELRGEIYGDGPDRDEVLRLRAKHGLDEALEVPGRVEAEQVERALARALCMVLPSSREGYGLVVVEASAAGTPSVVVAGPDNAATGLIVEGANGYVAPSASPEDLAAAFERVHAEGQGLRDRTAAWFSANAQRLSLSGSLDKVLDSYRSASARR